MTAEPHPQRCETYLIPLEELLEIKMLAEDMSDCKGYSDYLERFVQIVTETLSRPYTPVKSKRGRPICGSAECLRIIKPHENRVARAEREKVLDEFLEWVNDQPQDCICHFYLWKKIAELRSKQGEP